MSFLFDFLLYREDQRRNHQTTAIRVRPFATSTVSVKRKILTDSLAGIEYIERRIKHGRCQIRNPIPPCMWALCTLYLTSWVKHPVAAPVWCGSLDRGVPTQVSSSSLQVPSQNSPRVASKRYFNVTKLN
ncbi:hypothetical protein AVEN_231053-1 [Araneus ventricosus]|uniref:Uncharacterized protein n=1 Tax=Araneus ventricosus TaxID=182803 RepID=A0A4Y2A317_ARAVE|nr:hypothetical protein AVEN_231053-1 [Araneus ventricosus]